MQEPIGRKMDKVGECFKQNFKQNFNISTLNDLLSVDAYRSRNGITQQELADKLFCDKVQVVRIIDYLSRTMATLNGYKTKRINENTN